ncbi:glycosyltransferase [Phenylobacterium immobile]|uniref:glycosyltransferase n=1 Tax=Phenylobacterium immobile TaxID=21 RepID=UPI000A8FDB2B|nr:glycosyltransferase [Phenylobacterium immobile]
MSRWPWERKSVSRPQAVAPDAAATALVEASPATMDEADRLRDAGDWPNAASAYRRFLEAEPDHVAAWVQYGHASKEAGQLEEAVGAYLRATTLAPQDADAQLQLGHGLKLSGEVVRATEAYRRAYELAPDLADARSELIALGARELIDEPPGDQDALYEVSRELDALRRAITRLEKRLPALEAFATIPLAHHAEFRRAFDVVGDPGAAASPVAFAIIVEAAEDDPAGLRDTLLSLMDQSHGAWTATVRAHPRLLADRAGTYGHLDGRIRLVPGDDGLARQADLVVALRAGVTLDPRSLAWFAETMRRTGASAAYPDFDHRRRGAHNVVAHSDPRLLGPFEIDALLQSEELLQAPCFVREVWNSVGGDELAWADRLREGFLTAQGDGPIAHIPRLLASRPVQTARDPAPAASVMRGAWLHSAALDGAPVTVWPPSDPAERITVIIPSRDRPDMLGACVESLIAHAKDRVRLDILIVDNASEQMATKLALQDYARAGVARTLRVEEPFNWSRLNNLAAKTGHGLLLFLNDDVVMLTPDWDELLLGYAQQPRTSVIGARLVYPDRRIQHAGVALSCDDSPRHEGVGRPAADSGPGERWARTRSVGAVTGAFLAVRKDLFDTLGGFDEAGLPIDFSDVDFCLKARAAGGKVVYAPAISLIHAESQSRGLNVRARERAWEASELTVLQERWGRGMLWDPASNPYYRPSGRPVEALRAPAIAAVWDWIDASVSPNPWGIRS